MKKKVYPIKFHALLFRTSAKPPLWEGSWRVLHVLPVLGLLLFLFILLLLPTFALAQSPPISATPTSLTLTGLVGGGPLVAGLRLTTSTPVTNVQVMASDLQDITGDGRFRDAIPGNSVTVLPAPQITTLITNSLTTLAIQVEPPAQAGTYSGTLTIHWQEPEPGELVLPLTVIARTQPDLIIETPNQLTINSEFGQQVTRQIILRETVGGSPVTGLQALPQDLLTANGAAAIPARAISVTVPTIISGGQITTATFKLNLTGVSAGGYNGNVLFTTPLGKLLLLPMAVNVKHSSALPLLVLFIGVVLGIGLTIYQEQGRPRDKVVVRVVAVRQAITDDQDLNMADGPAQGFYLALEQHLTTAESHLRTDNWSAAADAVTQAETVLDRWRGLRPAWLEVLRYIHRLPEKRLKLDGSQTLAELVVEQKALLQTAPTTANPTALRQAVVSLEQKLVRYEYLRNLLTQAGSLRTTIPDLPPETKEQWRQTENRLGAKLNQLSPDKLDEWSALEQQLLDLLAQMQTAQEKAGVKGRSAEAPAPNIAAGVPDVINLRPLGLAEGQDAASRIVLFTCLAYGVSAVVLIWSGYVILYADQPAFGAKSTDYLTLLTWGLGGQTAFATITNRLINWGLGRTGTPS